MSSITLQDTISLSKLTFLEAADLSRLLEKVWGISGAVPETSDDLAPEEWVLADLIALKAEATALSQSLDESRHYVQTRCRQVMENQTWPLWTPS